MESSSGVQEYLGGNEPVEVIRTRSSPFGIPLLQCGTSHMIDNQSVSSAEEEEDDDDDDDASRYDQPNRDTSLMEDDEEENDGELSLQLTRSASSANNNNDADRNYHPALITAEYAEGQEAMWNEDECSTVVSVLVKPDPVAKHKKKGRFGGLRRLVPAITIPEDKEVELPQKVHVRKMKMKKTVVLLPQQGDEGAKTLVEANVKQEAAINMVKARQLLDQALLAEGENRLEDSEKLAKTAFSLASIARRMMTQPEEQPELETVLSVLAEKGEHAAFEHQQIVITQTFEESKSIAETPTKSKRNGVMSAASECANRAKHYLESILPKNVEKELQESLSQEIMASDTISTLGLKSDTSEYEMRPAPSNPTKSYTNMDLMSISSLNEILDGPEDDGNNENKPPSPRQMLPVIDVPNRTPSSKVQAPSKKWISLSPKFHTKLSVKTEESQEESEIPDKPKASTPNQKDIEKLKPSSTPEKEEAPLKPKKKWGLLKKLRRNNKQGNKETPDIVPEPTKTLEDESQMEEMSKASEVDEVSQDSNEIPPLTDGPSASFESASGGSKTSRYHIGKKNSSSEEKKSIASESVGKSQQQQDDEKSQQQDVEKSKSVESIRHLDTSKSDWDQTPAFERHPVRKMPVKELEIKVILAPTRASGVTTTPAISVDQSLKRSESDWDEATGPRKKLMQKKSIASLSSDESSARETASRTEERSQQDKPISETPMSQWTASVMTHGRDFRSTQGNTGTETVVETVAESEMEESQTQTQTQSRHSKEEEASMPVSAYESTASATEHGSSKGKRSEKSEAESKSESRQSESKKSRESFPHPTEESTQAGKDSLIDFVISPRRANVITPGGRRPFETDEPSKIMIPTLHPIGEQNIEEEANEEDYEQHSSVNLAPKADKQPKIMRRISSLFGPRKAKGQHPVEESFDIEKQDSGEKDLAKAISDGNMRAYGTNLNAENAQSITTPSQAMSQGKSVEGTENDETSTVLVLEQALSNAEKKAEEANLEVETAPFPHRKSRRKHPSSRPVPLDLVDAIRMQAGLERNTRKDPVESAGRRESTADAPGTLQIETDGDNKDAHIDADEAPRMDPPKDDAASYRVLAPTPRQKKPSTEEEKGTEQGDNQTFDKSTEREDKNADQRRISELLYGPSTSSDSFAIQEKISSNGVEKGVYIGDLIGNVTSKDEVPVSDENGETPTEEDDSKNEDDHDGENAENENGENEQEPLDKENENVILSPKAGNNTPTPRGRLSLGSKRGPRKSMLSGIRNLISSSGQ
jgi:hypothetical protein